VIRWRSAVWAGVVLGAVSAPTTLLADARQLLVDVHSGLDRRTDSMTCLGCHDGLIARDASGHPIGRAYDAAALDDRRLRPRAILPEAVTLEDGRVGCISCHDPASALPARLTMPNRGSALCFACHAM